LAGCAPLEATRTVLARSDLACWLFGAAFGLAPSVLLPSAVALCACATPAMAKEPSARLDRPRVPYGRCSAVIRGARSASFRVFRLDLRLIRHLPLERNVRCRKTTTDEAAARPMPGIGNWKPPYAMVLICYRPYMVALP